MDKQQAKITEIIRAVESQGGRVLRQVPVTPGSTTILLTADLPGKQMTFRVAADGSFIPHTV